MRSEFFLFLAGPSESAAGGLSWLASLSRLKSASRLTISWFLEPNCRPKSFSWLPAPTDLFLVVKILPTHGSTPDAVGVGGTGAHSFFCLLRVVA